MTAEWIQSYLPKLRCPCTSTGLRYATDLEKSRAGIDITATALANEPGTHVYPVIDGILRLLPADAILI